jgi:hypothetical protein
MSDTMNDPNTNDPNKRAMTPTPAEAVDKARPPAQQVRWTARATHRAMEGWQRVASEQDWLRILEESREAYESGGFLLERLGAERYLDPKLMATILMLRQRVLDEWAITTAAETMLVDLALLSYYPRQTSVSRPSAFTTSSFGQRVAHAAINIRVPTPVSRISASQSPARSVLPNASASRWSVSGTSRMDGAWIGSRRSCGSVQPSPPPGGSRS